MAQSTLLTNRLARNNSLGGKPPAAINGLLEADDYPDNVFRIAHHIANIVIPANPDGFTIDPATLKMPSFSRSVFLVSRKDREQKFEIKPGIMEVSGWLRKNYDLLSRPAYYIGGWWDSGIFFLDVSLPIQGMYAALNAAYANQQRAIYHPFSGKSYYLPKAA